MCKGEEYLALRNIGMTYQGIANIYGVSRQAVQSTLTKYKNWSKGYPPKDMVPYDGLRMWMAKNHVRVAELERRTGFKLRFNLKEKSLNTDKINAIIEVTGLSYETLFA